MTIELAEAMEQVRTRPTVRVPVACAVLDLSDWAGYQAIKRGEFPAPVITVGRRIVVQSAGLRHLLGLTSEAS
jgi:predicted DNA-binding transcriptional regulator AlpA